MNNEHVFTLLYDGRCPICRKEVNWLQSRNKQNKLGLQDIHAEGFNPADYGKSLDELMAEIHGVNPDGRVIKGMPVFYAAYSAVGLGWLMAPTRWPLLKPLFDRLYALFARHRLRLGTLFGAKPCQDASCSIRSGHGKT
ncbi:thiol-disulfide oxidoreductase DCC family protein [Methylomonas sp. BW4-1]|uniref:thiol-disulfide oxidoreductase DCC family protein n=1 Tax=Methylomonas sp. BW4-1 TaxID=3376685 RepID=UPI004041064A